MTTERPTSITRWPAPAEREEAPAGPQTASGEDALALLRSLELLPIGLALTDEQGALLAGNSASLAHLEALGASTPGALIGAGLGASGLALSQSTPPAERVAEDGRAFEVRALRTDDVAGRPRWVLLTREVTPERELRRRVVAEERWSAMGQLAAGLANDFANLLAAVMVITELMLQREDLPEEVVEDCESIHSLAERGATLVRRVLDFGQQRPGEPVPTDLAALLEQVVALVRQTLPAHTTVSLAEGAGPGWVAVDASQIVQVLLNLIANAREAMPGGGEIRLALASRSLRTGDPRPASELPDGPFLVVSVQDAGRGIEPTLLPRIFEPFFTTKPLGQGVGLGLSQALGLVRSHGGALAVQSTPGEGTTAEVWLPALTPKASGSPA